MATAKALEIETGDVLTADELRRAGLSRSARAYRTRPGGPWQRPLPGVYVSQTGELTAWQRLEAALSYGGPRAQIGGPTAAALHGVRTVPQSALVHLLLPHDVRRASTSFVRVRRSTRAPTPVFIQHLPVAPVARSVVDTCLQLRRLSEVRAVVAEPVQRRATTVTELARELERAPSAGSALMRAVLAEVADGAMSAAEAEFRSLLATSNLPRPVLNAVLVDTAGRFLACVDGWWEDAGVGLELDSREWHLLPEHWERTMRRHELLARHGVLVLHVSPSRVRNEPNALLSSLRATLAARAGAGAPLVRHVPDVRR